MEHILKKDTKRGGFKHSLVFAAIGILFVFAIYMMFKDTYVDIIRQLCEVKLGYFLVVLALGFLYYLFDAYMFQILITRKHKGFRMKESLEVNFLGVFMNVTTFGAGIKPAQTYYLYKKGIDVGEGLGILMLPYIYHKTCIMLYATIVLLVNNEFIRTQYAASYQYIYATYVISTIIVVVLILLCTAKWFRKLVAWLLDFVMRKEEWQEKKEMLKSQMLHLQEESSALLSDVKLWTKLIVVNLIKMTWWYVIPYVAIRAVGAENTLAGVSLLQVIITAAFMQLVVGVIPVTGGMVATEVVYMLLFSVLLGDVTAGATMILYRLATYYIPFLVSIVLVTNIRRKKEM